MQFKSPFGVAVNKDGRILVADYSNHRLQVLTAEGAFIATVGDESRKFKWDIAINQDGKLFVTEITTKCVQVLNADLTYSHSIRAEFDPRGITIDAEGLIYVADRGNNRVQKFTPEGKLLAVIDSKGEGGGRLNKPYGLCFDRNGILYVTENGSNTVSMFTSEGRFLGYIGNSDGSSFNRPIFIISDQTGRLYISDDKGVHIY